MKVVTKTEKNDCYVGDIVEYNSIPCMVIEMGNSLEYGLVALEGFKTGQLIKTTLTLSSIDSLARIVLIKSGQVVISKEEE